MTSLRPLSSSSISNVQGAEGGLARSGGIPPYEIEDDSRIQAANHLNAARSIASADRDATGRAENFEEEPYSSQAIKWKAECKRLREQMDQILRVSIESELALIESDIKKMSEDYEKQINTLASEGRQRQAKHMAEIESLKEEYEREGLEMLKLAKVEVRAQLLNERLEYNVEVVQNDRLLVASELKVARKELDEKDRELEKYRDKVAALERERTKFQEENENLRQRALQSQRSEDAVQHSNLILNYKQYLSKVNDLLKQGRKREKELEAKVQDSEEKVGLLKSQCSSLNEALENVLRAHTLSVNYLQRRNQELAEETAESVQRLEETSEVLENTKQKLDEMQLSANDLNVTNQKLQEELRIKQQELDANNTTLKETLSQLAALQNVHVDKQMEPDRSANVVSEFQKNTHEHLEEEPVDEHFVLVEDVEVPALAPVTEEEHGSPIVMADAAASTDKFSETLMEECGPIDDLVVSHGSSAGLPLQCRGWNRSDEEWARKGETKRSDAMLILRRSTARIGTQQPPSVLSNVMTVPEEVVPVPATPIEPLPDYPVTLVEMNRMETSLFEKILSADPVAAQELLSMHLVVEGKKPSEDFWKRILKLILYGPWHNEVFFPDPYRMNIVTDYILSLFRTHGLLHDCTNCLSDIGNEAYGDVLLTQMAEDYYMAKGDLERETETATERILNTAHAKSCSARVFLEMIKFLFHDCVVGSKEPPCKVLFQQTPEECLRQGIVATKSIWKLSPRATGDAFRELTESWGTILSYLAWLYGQHASEDADALASILSDISYSVPSEVLFDVIDTLKPEILPQVRPKLAERWKLSEEYNLCYSILIESADGGVESYQESGAANTDRTGHEDFEEPLTRQDPNGQAMMSMETQSLQENTDSLLEDDGKRAAEPSDAVVAPSASDDQATQSIDPKKRIPRMLRELADFNSMSVSDQDVPPHPVPSTRKKRTRRSKRGC